MKLFTVKLTDEDRIDLDAYRARKGLRSESDAVRDLIRRTAIVQTAGQPFKPDERSLGHHGPKARDKC